MSNDDYQQILRKHWLKCKEELNCAAIRDVLWVDGLIDKSDFETINNSCTTEHSNGVVLHRLLMSATAPVLLKFAHLLQNYKPHIHTRHAKIGKEIECSLMEIVENC